MLGVRELLCPDHQGALTLLQAFAMASGRGLDHFILVRLHDLGLLVHPLLGCFQRLSEFLPRTLLMPVGTHDLFTTIVGIERTMVNHALEAVFLSLTALSVSLGHAVVSKASLTLGVPQYTKVLPSAGSTMTTCLGSSGLGA